LPEVDGDDSSPAAFIPNARIAKTAKLKPNNPFFILPSQLSFPHSMEDDVSHVEFVILDLTMLALACPVLDTGESSVFPRFLSRFPEAAFAGVPFLTTM
jgi:hypothetical protein